MWELVTKLYDNLLTHLMTRNFPWTLICLYLFYLTPSSSLIKLMPPQKSGITGGLKTIRDKLIYEKLFNKLMGHSYKKYFLRT